MLNSYNHDIGLSIEIHDCGTRKQEIVHNIIKPNYIVDLQLKLVLYCSGGWCWPTSKDILWYSRCNVIKKVDQPIPVNARGLFTVEGVQQNN